MIVIGIDPGVTGGVALYSTSVGHTYVFDMPIVSAKRGKAAMDVTAAELARLIRPHQASRVIVEQVSSRPRQAGQFAFGTNYGRVLGCIETLGLPLTLVPAQVWKQALGLRGEDKSMSVKLAAELFPSVKDQLFGPRGAPLDGRAEALLLCYYGAHHAT